MLHAPELTRPGETPPRWACRKRGPSASKSLRPQNCIATGTSQKPGLQLGPCFSVESQKRGHDVSFSPFDPSGKTAGVPGISFPDAGLHNHRPAPGSLISNA